jgi:hypothetical protein
MRKLLLILAFVTAPAFAGVIVSTVITGTGGAPIPVAYDLTDAKSKVVTGLLQSAEEVCAYNATSAIVAIYLDNKATSGTAPTAAVKDIYIPAATGVCVKTRLSATVLLRSASGSTITSGSVYISVLSGARP